VKANQEQQDAFAKGDPTLMQDTATSSYYAQIAQTNTDMKNGGVSAIKLVKLEWGPIVLQGPTSAQATTFETWRTTYADGSTDQGREQNVYTLVQEQGAWKVQTDDHPGSGQGQAAGVSASPPSRPSGPNSTAGAVPPASKRITISSR
jgi:hypothetical protein